MQPHVSKNDILFYYCYRCYAVLIYFPVIISIAIIVVVLLCPSRMRVCCEKGCAVQAPRHVWIIKKRRDQASRVVVKTVDVQHVPT